MKKKTKVAPAVPYEPFLLEKLKDPEFAALYLTDCIRGPSDDESIDLFFSALFEICKARGISLSAEAAHLTRDVFSKALKGHHNPTFKTFRKILNSQDLDIKIVPLAHMEDSRDRG